MATISGTFKGSETRHEVEKELDWDLTFNYTITPHFSQLRLEIENLDDAGNWVKLIKPRPNIIPENELAGSFVVPVVKSSPSHGFTMVKFIFIREDADDELSYDFTY